MFRLYSVHVRRGFTRFQGQIWGDFSAIWRDMLVWRIPKAAREIRLLKTFLG